MKNFIRTLALATLFIFSLSSFTAGENSKAEKIVLEDVCDDYATAAMENEMNLMYPGETYTNEEYGERWLYHYYQCKQEEDEPAQI